MTYRLAPDRRPGLPNSRRRMVALGATGVVTPGGDPKVRLLQQQINRFVPSRYAQPLPVNGVMDYAVAIAAAGILYDRAKAAYDQYGAGERAGGPYGTVLAQAQTHLNGPLPWVPQNIDQVIAEVSAYADFKGLPAAEGGVVKKLIGDWRVWVAAAGVGVVVLARRKRSR